MSINFEITNISLDKSNNIESVILISFSFEYKIKNLEWKFDKAYDIFIDYFNKLILKVPNVSKPPLITDYVNNAEQFLPKLKGYISNLFKRKEIYKLVSFQKLFEFPDELIENQITIDTLSNITEYNILDFYFDEPYLFISSGNSNSVKALSFLLSYFQVKGFFFIYRMNSSPGSYGEKKLIIVNKREEEKYITKIKRIKDFLFLGFNNGSIEILSFNKEKKELFNYSNVDNIESKLSINENFKITNLFYKSEKGLIYVFIEKAKKVCIYEINSNNHIKDIVLTDNPIIYSHISFDMKKLFVIDSNGTFWIYELNLEENTVKLLQASYTKLNDISTTKIFKEKTNDQTLNIFVGLSDKVQLYQYSNKSNSFTLKLECNTQFKVNSIIYVNQYKCLMIGCENGTIQFWKHSSKNPEYILETGYPKVNKLFYDEKNKYIFINCNKDLKIFEINLENILMNDNEEKEKDNSIIAETLKDEGDKVVENNMMLISKSFQTPESSPDQSQILDEKNKSKEINNNINENSEITNDEKNELNISNKETEDEINIEENEYNYEVRNVDCLDGWSEW